jgi:hypothetical protein
MLRASPGRQNHLLERHTHHGEDGVAEISDDCDSDVNFHKLFESACTFAEAVFSGNYSPVASSPVAENCASSASSSSALLANFCPLKDGHRLLALYSFQKARKLAAKKGRWRRRNEARMTFVLANWFRANEAYEKRREAMKKSKAERRLSTRPATLDDEGFSESTENRLYLLFKSLQVFSPFTERLKSVLT